MSHGNEDIVIGKELEESLLAHRTEIILLG